MDKNKKSFYVRFMLFNKKLKKFFTNLIFPDDIKCLFCGKDIPDFHKVPYCEECKKELPFNIGNRCEICDQPIYNEATVCDYCQKEKRNFHKLYCPFLYDGKIKNSILGFKDSNHKYKAPTFAKLIVDYMNKKDFDYITYIPMTEKKEKKRGFNQSKLLAEEIGKIINKPVLTLFEKIKDVGEQKSFSYKERRDKVVGAFKLKKYKFNKTDKVLLVDDIVTTGSTVNYCSGLLYPKVDKVYVCAIARETIGNFIKKQSK